MGIKGLHKFIKDKFPQVLSTVHLSNFSYETIAIDVSLYAYKYKAVNPHYWLTSFINLIGCLRRNRVHCIFIYDNKCPVEKEEERQRRKDEMKKREVKVNQLAIDLDTYKDTDTVSPLLKEFSDKHQTKNILINILNVSLLEDKLRRMKEQIFYFTSDDVEKTKQVFSILGVPYQLAPEEAEAMAAKLCKRHKVKAVLSEDSDVLAYRSPILLCKIDTHQNTCVQIEYKKLLKEFGWTSDQFTDFCIMCGTDYNKNIPKVGPVTAYNLINEYKSIDNIKDMYDITILNHIRIREIFKHPKAYKIKEKYCGKPDLQQLQNFYDDNNLNYYHEKIVNDFFVTDFVLEDI